MQVTVEIPDVVARGRSPAVLSAELTNLTVLEAFRCGEISSGRAAHLLDMSGMEFLTYASSRGVATMNYDAEDFARELADIAAGGAWSSP